MCYYIVNVKRGESTTMCKETTSTQPNIIGDTISHEHLCSDTLYVVDNVFDMLKESSIISIDMIVDGQGIHRVRDQDIPCKVGDIFVIPPDVSHGYFVEKESETLKIRRLSFDIPKWFETDASISDRPTYCYGLFRGNSVVACAVLNATNRESISALYDAIEREIINRDNQWQRVVRGYLSILFITVSRYIDCAIKDVQFASTREWRTVLSAIKIIKSNYTDSDLTLESIANELYISKTHLSELFYKITDKKFSEYLRVLRMDNACALLTNTDKTIEDVAHECGLKDIPSFYKNFNAYTGMTPSEYRKANVTLDDESKQYKKSLRGDKIMSILKEIESNVQIGKAKIVKELVAQALAEGVRPADILSTGLLAGMNVIGEKFKNNEVYVPEVLVAARAMNMGMQELKPYLSEAGVSAKGKVCIGTVRGDLHDIGKNLVRMMMEGKGIEVIDLGTDVAPETFVKTAIDENCQIICCSALLTTTMDVMADVVKEAEKAGIRDKVKIMVGGAPVSQEFANSIGADFYTIDAASAADTAEAICRG